MIKKLLILFLIISHVTSAPQYDDLFTSNELCLKYLNANGISPTSTSGECVISCKQLNGRRQCFTNDNGCLSYATYVFQNNYGRDGQFYCNVLPYQSNSLQQQQRISSDDQRVCTDFKRSLPSSNSVFPCSVKCANLYAIASTQGGHEYKFLCEPLQSNFVGCKAYANYISSKSTAGGIFNCQIFNHGDNFDYNRANGGSYSGLSSLFGGNSYNNERPLNTGYLSSVVDVGNRISEGISQSFTSGVNAAANLATAPFQLFLSPFRSRYRQ